LNNIQFNILYFSIYFDTNIYLLLQLNHYITIIIELK